MAPCPPKICLLPKLSSWLLSEGKNLSLHSHEEPSAVSGDPGNLHFWEASCLDSFYRLVEMPGYTVMCVLMRLEDIRELLLGLLNPTQRTHLKWQISQINCRSFCSLTESKGVLVTWEGIKRLLGRPPLQSRQDWLFPPHRSHSPTTSHRSQSFCFGTQGPSTEHSISARTQLQTVAPN